MQVPEDLLYPEALALYGTAQKDTGDAEHHMMGRTDIIGSRVRLDYNASWEKITDPSRPTFRVFHAAPPHIGGEGEGEFTKHIGRADQSIQAPFFDEGKCIEYIVRTIDNII